MIQRRVSLQAGRECPEFFTADFADSADQANSGTPLRAFQSFRSTAHFFGGLKLLRGGQPRMNTKAHE
jgi:hypothetical protein